MTAYLYTHPLLNVDPPILNILPCQDAGHHHSASDLGETRSKTTFLNSIHEPEQSFVRPEKRDPENPADLSNEVDIGIPFHGCRTVISGAVFFPWMREMIRLFVLESTVSIKIFLGRLSFTAYSQNTGQSFPNGHFC